MQYGFYFDQTRCIGCHTCSVACKDNHDIKAGPAKWIRVTTIERGKFPTPFLAFLFGSCFHCAEPDCVLACPVGAITKRDRDGIVIIDREKCLGKGICAVCAPCRVDCPAGLNPEGYISLISKGRFNDALALIRETTPFAGVLGRVCTHPCETSCKRGKVDEAVAICSLKRFMADYELRAGRERARPVAKAKEKRVAVIGSGPAGLSCAYDLVRQGYPVTILEAAPQSGGLMRYGIPRYRLPKNVLDNEINYVEELGAEMKTNTPINDLEYIFNQGYEAVFIATGAWKSQKLGVPNEDANGVIHALDLLNQVNSGKKVRLGQKVAVVGGGSVAIDAARTSLRLGARETHLICLECRDLTARDRMPAQDQEIEEAEKEGVIIHPCLGVSNIMAYDGMVTGLSTINCVSVHDEQGMFAPKFGKYNNSNIEASNVIIAIGQSVDHSMLPDELEYNAKGVLSVDPVTLQTNVKGVFAGGDVVTGAGNIISAIAAGKEAAISIVRYLGGLDLREGRHILLEQVDWVTKKDSETRQRGVMPLLTLAKRKGFDEVELGFDEITAVKESRRCLHCGQCFSACSYGAPQFGVEDNPKMQKCDLCFDLDRWDRQKKPICVTACPVRALDAGPTDELTSKYGGAKEAVGFIYCVRSKPSVVFRLKKGAA